MKQFSVFEWNDESWLRNKSSLPAAMEWISRGSAVMATEVQANRERGMRIAHSAGCKQMPNGRFNAAEYFQLFDIYEHGSISPRVQGRIRSPGCRAQNRGLHCNNKTASSVYALDGNTVSKLCWKVSRFDMSVAILQALNVYQNRTSAAT